ncbi:hypothetical protein OIU77_025276 [Salix suchowensis]|uniref:Uncharacterized protein n=1 Tax=Salix suchowensis TaxID=1278906 RepID=A0ABQ9BVQ9_9ROSI|nr:hypothetical protein OIU77_025276 [Salix suchowensis]
MNVSASEYSSGGCESGWTSYFDQSSNSKHQYQGFGGFADGEYTRLEEEQEEDLSMVSDASSGPPHYGEDGGYGCDKLERKSQSKKEEQRIWVGANSIHILMTLLALLHWARK